MQIKQETLELIFTLSNTAWLINENIKTDRLNRIRTILENEFPDLKDTI